jgi:hypothetical protein
MFNGALTHAMEFESNWIRMGSGQGRSASSFADTQHSGTRIRAFSILFEAHAA